MNTGQKNTFHLSNLPPDIIRMILQMEKPESIDHLRLISPSWKALIDEYLNSIQLPTIDFICLNFIASIFNKPENELKMIIIGRKSKFVGAELFTFYDMVDRQLFRILRRCSKIDTLNLNVSIGSRLDSEAPGLLRSYIGNIPIRLVKVASIMYINDVELKVISDFIEFNAVVSFEIEIQNLYIYDLMKLNALPLNGSRSIKFFDYTHKQSSTLFFQTKQQLWENYAQTRRKDCPIRAMFTPDNVEYHLQIIHTARRRLQSNIRPVIAPSPTRMLSASLARIRDATGEIKIAIANLQNDSSFDLNKFLLRDNVLLALNRSEKFEKAPEIEINLAKLPLEIVRKIIRMEKPESLDHLRLISHEWRTGVNEFLGDENNLPKFNKRLEFVESEINPLKLRLETISMSRHSPYSSDNWIEYLTSDPQLYRIQRRCSRIETLFLKLPSGSHFDHETIGILQSYVGNIPVCLVKVSGLAKFDIFARNALFELARVNGVRYFEIATRSIDGSQLDYFWNITTNLDAGSESEYKILTIKFRDYAHRSQSTLYFNEDESVWKEFAWSMTNRGTVHAVFYPEDDGFHLKIVSRSKNRATALDRALATMSPRRVGMQCALPSLVPSRGYYSSRDVGFSYFSDSKSDKKGANQWFESAAYPKPDKNRDDIAKSVKIIREELKKIKRSVKQLQSSSTFDLEQFIASDTILYALRHYLTRQ